MKNKAVKLTALLLAIALLAGCGSVDRGAAGYEIGEERGEKSAGLMDAISAVFSEPVRETSVGEDSGFTDFDSALIKFLAYGYGERSFLVSPLSFRAALALAVVGAEGETKSQLLQLMGFADEEEMFAWYEALLRETDAFAAASEREQEWFEKAMETAEEDPLYSVHGTQTERSFRLVNSIWDNTDLPDEFLDEYLQRAAALRAEVFGAPEAELVDAVNAWVNEQTQGMIPRIVEALPGVAAALVNALYLRTAWEYDFGWAEEDVFTTAQGEEKTMDFMHQHTDLRYYEDRDTQLVILPMKGDIKAAFVLGSTEDIRGKLDAASWEDVVVTIPKFELETELQGDAFVIFLQTHGAGLSTQPDEADFSAMFKERWVDGEKVTWYIKDVVQKSKIKVDEEGIEAAAATAIIMAEPGAAPEKDPPKPKIFTADRPFAFYLYSTHGSEPELLFFGQFMG